MRKAITKVRERMTRKNIVWFAKTNVTSWVIQGSLIAVFSLVGMETMRAMVSAKVAAYVVFGVQCVKQARA
jgi:hypothetical protein